MAKFDLVMIYLAIKLKKSLYTIFVWEGGGGGGHLSNNIYLSQIYKNSKSVHFKYAQCKLIVCQNLISNDLFGN